MDTRRSTAYLPLAAIILAAAVLQSILTVRGGTVSADSITFIGMARDLAEHPIETFRQQDQHPGFPAAVLATTRVVQWLGYRAEPESWTASARILTFVCGLLSVLVVWLLGRSLFGQQAANLAALVWVVLPIPRWNAADGQSDTVHLFLYLLAAWLLVTAINSGRWPRFAAAGLASGLAYWIRPEGLEVAVAATGCCMLFALRGLARCPSPLAGEGGECNEPGEGTRPGVDAPPVRFNLLTRWQLVRSAGIVAVVAALVALPYCVLAGKLTSKQLPFAKAQPSDSHIGQLADDEARAKLPPPQPAAAAAASVPNVASEPPAPAAAAPPQTPPRRYTLSLVARMIGRAFKAFAYAIGQGFKVIFLPFYLLGTACLIYRRQWTPALAFLTALGLLHVAILLGVYIMSGYIAHRHVMPIVALATPVTALGLIAQGHWLAKRLRVQDAYGVAMVTAACAIVVLPYTLRPLNREFLPVVAATRWVNERADRGTGIVCNSPYVAFYGTLPTAMIHPEAPSVEAAIAKAGHQARYDYVILHIGAHQYQASWVADIEKRYHQVQELPDPYCLPRKPRKVVVYEANDLEARRR